MTITQIKPRPRNANTRPCGQPVPARAVQGMLLELAYRLHATRVVKRLPEPARAVAACR